MDIEDIVSIGAHSLRAINVAISWITDATTNLAVIPATVGEGLGVLNEESVVIVSIGSCEMQVLDVLACSMSRAIIGAGSSLAALSFIPIKALALASLAIANTAIGTLGILVE